MDAEANNGACPRYEATLEDYLTGQLSGAEAKHVADHLAECSACRAAFEQAAPAARLLALAEPAPDPGPAFARIAMARIRQQMADAEKGFWQPFVVLAWRFAATVAVVLALAVSYEVVRGQRRAPAPEAIAQARLNDMSYMFSAEQERVPSTRDDVLLMVAEAKNGNH